MRSWLYCPGNSPRMMLNAGVYGADGIVFDLEDAVPAGDKDQARILLAQMISDVDYPGTGLAVRINGLDTQWWKDDITCCAEAVARAGRNIPLQFRIPKIESENAVSAVERFLARLENALNLEAGRFMIQCIMETPLGVERAFMAAGASARISGISFGAEDYCTALGVHRYSEPYVLDYPRSRVAAAAAAFGIEAYDTVWGAYKDIEGLQADALRARMLGFSGKSAIHPGQVSIINRVFSPSEEEISWAESILEKAGDAEGGGTGSLDGVMIDKPVVLRARRILAEAGNAD